ncbi:Uncharacterized protein dnl_21610 [Desulfonema limicola]|uniref:Uncharacterized protein n=1 Tax=Desulfonema limicola TaxID=45656 RepID=A0A975B6R7_9BACT|nr:Uncharacterized protein dnl_21610 [Desulfonema limicola]
MNNYKKYMVKEPCYANSPISFNLIACTYNLHNKNICINNKNPTGYNSAIRDIEPGICGCNTADTDKDLDEVYNCNDECPNDSDKSLSGQ